MMTIAKNNLAQVSEAHSDSVRPMLADPNCDPEIVDRAIAAYDTAARLHRHAMRCESGAKTHQTTAGALRDPHIAKQIEDTAIHLMNAAQAARLSAEQWMLAGHKYASTAKGEPEAQNSESPGPITRRTRK